MKTLEKEFKCNNDKCGIHTFKQIKRVGNVAIYERTTSSGQFHSYEVVKIKLVKAGTVFAKGAAPIAEDYESYPGAKTFGRGNAYACVTMENAEKRFDQLVNSQIASEEELEEVSEETEVIGEKIEKKDGRGRKAKDRSGLKFPIRGEKFEMKVLEAMNPDFSFAFLYQHVKSLLGIQFKVVGTVSAGRGKPKILYSVL